MYRGIHGVILDENEPPDVHGIPKDLEAYGRGGWYTDGSLFYRWRTSRISSGSSPYY